MPRVSQVYSAAGGWLKASVFIEANIDQAVFTVLGAVVQDCKDFHGNIKPGIVLTLQGSREERQWELNKTNGDRIVEFLGDDTDHWTGHQVGIKLIRGVRFPFGERDILEAYNPTQQPQPANGHAVAAAAPRPTPAPEPVAAPHPASSGDDDLPF